MQVPNGDVLLLRAGSRLFRQPPGWHADGADEKKLVLQDADVEKFVVPPY